MVYTILLLLGWLRIKQIKYLKKKCFDMVEVQVLQSRSIGKAPFPVRLLTEIRA